MSENRTELQELEEKAEKLKSEQKFLECLDVLETILNKKRENFGPESQEYNNTSQKLCELCNMISLVCLQKEKFEQALEFLKKAEILSISSQNLRALTFNNYACYYRKQGKLRTAHDFLQKALAIELYLENPPSLADTHLNLCAVLSQLDRHQEALEQVLFSVVLLQDELLQKKADSEGQIKPDRHTVLAIAYHNMGVELEYLKRYKEAIDFYKKAHSFAKTHLPPDAEIIRTLNDILGNAQSQIQEKNNQETKKKGQFKDQKQKMQVQARFQGLSGIYSSELSKRASTNNQTKNPRKNLERSPDMHIIEQPQPQQSNYANN